MTVALDADVLVAWAMSGAPGHDGARRLVAAEGGEGGTGIALVPQVLFEFLHVVTDERRFERPLPMREALLLARRMWEARDVLRIVPGPLVLPRTLELLSDHRLGRKRILDVALAATLEGAGILSLATFNGRDFEVFPFLEIVVPD